MLSLGLVLLLFGHVLPVTVWGWLPWKSFGADKGSGTIAAEVALERRLKCTMGKIPAAQCPQDGGWGTWGPWGPCNGECGQTGRRERLRACVAPAPARGGAPCRGDDTDAQPCDVQGCSEQQYAQGVQGDPIREQQLVVLKEIHGRYASLVQRCLLAHCRYDTVRRVLCGEATKYWNALHCVKHNVGCPVPGGWSAWERWTACSAVCGQGQRFRNRSCNNPPPSLPEYRCTGDAFQAQPCTGAACAVRQEGVWTQWSQWSECSASCGRGVSRRERQCLRGRRRRRGLSRAPEQPSAHQYDSLTAPVYHGEPSHLMRRSTSRSSASSNQLIVQNSYQGNPETSVTARINRRLLQEITDINEQTSSSDLEEEYLITTLKPLHDEEPLKGHESDSYGLQESEEEQEGEEKEEEREEEEKEEEREEEKEKELTRDIKLSSERPLLHEARFITDAEIISDPESAIEEELALQLPTSSLPQINRKMHKGSVVFNLPKEEIVQETNHHRIIDKTAGAELKFRTRSWQRQVLNVESLPLSHISHTDVRALGSSFPRETGQTLEVPSSTVSDSPVTPLTIDYPSSPLLTDNKTRAFQLPSSSTDQNLPDSQSLFDSTPLLSSSLHSASTTCHHLNQFVAIKKIKDSALNSTPSMDPSTIRNKSTVPFRFNGRSKCSSLTSGKPGKPPVSDKLSVPPLIASDNSPFPFLSDQNPMALIFTFAPSQTPPFTLHSPFTRPLIDRSIGFLLTSHVPLHRFHPLIVSPDSLLLPGLPSTLTTATPFTGQIVAFAPTSYLKASSPNARQLAGLLPNLAASSKHALLLSGSVKNKTSLCDVHMSTANNLNLAYPNATDSPFYLHSSFSKSPASACSGVTKAPNSNLLVLLRNRAPSTSNFHNSSQVTPPTQTRSEQLPRLMNMGSLCSGPFFEMEECNITSCSVDGGWSPWQAWGACSAQCGVGAQARSRACSRPAPQGAGRPCAGPASETRACFLRPCSVRTHTVATFGGASHLLYAASGRPSRLLLLFLRFRSLTPSGTLFARYEENCTSSQCDQVSLALEGRYLMLSAQLTGCVAVVLYPAKIELGRWHSALVTVTGVMATLRVDDAPAHAAAAFSCTPAPPQLDAPMHVGSGFTGQMQRLAVNYNPLRLRTSDKESEYASRTGSAPLTASGVTYEAAEAEEAFRVLQGDEAVCVPCPKDPNLWKVEVAARPASADGIIMVIPGVVTGKDADYVLVTLEAGQVRLRLRWGALHTTIAAAGAELVSAAGAAAAAASAAAVAAAGLSFGAAAPPPVAMNSAGVGGCWLLVTLRRVDDAMTLSVNGGDEARIALPTDVSVFCTGDFFVADMPPDVKRVVRHREARRGEGVLSALRGSLGAVTVDGENVDLAALPGELETAVFSSRAISVADAYEEVPVAMGDPLSISCRLDGASRTAGKPSRGPPPKVEWLHLDQRISLPEDAQTSFPKTPEMHAFTPQSGHPVEVGGPVDFKVETGDYVSTLSATKCDSRAAIEGFYGCWVQPPSGSGHLLIGFGVTVVDFDVEFHPVTTHSIMAVAALAVIAVATAYLVLICIMCTEKNDSMSLRQDLFRSLRGSKLTREQQVNLLLSKIRSPQGRLILGSDEAVRQAERRVMEVPPASITFTYFHIHILMPILNHAFNKILNNVLAMILSHVLTKIFSVYSSRSFKMVEPALNIRSSSRTTLSGVRQRSSRYSGNSSSARSSRTQEKSSHTSQEGPRPKQYESHIRKGEHSCFRTTCISSPTHRLMSVNSGVHVDTDSDRRKQVSAERRTANSKSQYSNGPRSTVTSEDETTTNETTPLTRISRLNSRTVITYAGTTEELSGEDISNVEVDDDESLEELDDSKNAPRGNESHQVTVSRKSGSQNPSKFYTEMEECHVRIKPSESSISHWSSHSQSQSTSQSNTKEELSHSFDDTSPNDPTANVSDCDDTQNDSNSSGLAFYGPSNNQLYTVLRTECDNNQLNFQNKTFSIVAPPITTHNTVNFHDVTNEQTLNDSLLMEPNQCFRTTKTFDGIHPIMDSSFVTEQTPRSQANVKMGHPSGNEAHHNTFNINRNKKGNVDEQEPTKTLSSIQKSFSHINMDASHPEIPQTNSLYVPFQAHSSIPGSVMKVSGLEDEGELKNLMSTDSSQSFGLHSGSPAAGDIVNAPLRLGGSRVCGNLRNIAAVPTKVSSKWRSINLARIPEDCGMEPNECTHSCMSQLPTLLGVGEQQYKDDPYGKRRACSAIPITHLTEHNPSRTRDVATSPAGVDHFYHSIPTLDRGVGEASFDEDSQQSNAIKRWDVNGRAHDGFWLNNEDPNIQNQNRDGCSEEFSSYQPLSSLAVSHSDEMHTRIGHICLDRDQSDVNRDNAIQPLPHSRKIYPIHSPQGSTMNKIYCTPDNIHQDNDSLNNIITNDVLGRHPQQTSMRLEQEDELIENSADTHPTKSILQNFKKLHENDPQQTYQIMDGEWGTKANNYWVETAHLHGTPTFNKLQNKIKNVSHPFEMGCGDFNPLPLKITRKKTIDLNTLKDNYPSSQTSISSGSYNPFIKLKKSMAKGKAMDQSNNTSSHENKYFQSDNFRNHPKYSQQLSSPREVNILRSTLPLISKSLEYVSGYEESIFSELSEYKEKTQYCTIGKSLQPKRTHLNIDIYSGSKYKSRNLPRNQFKLSQSKISEHLLDIDATVKDIQWAGSSSNSTSSKSRLSSASKKIIYK